MKWVLRTQNEILKYKSFFITKTEFWTYTLDKYIGSFDYVDYKLIYVRIILNIQSSQANISSSEI